MEVASKVLAKIFCKEEPKQNVNMLSKDDMETTISLAWGYANRLMIVMEAGVGIS